MKIKITGKDELKNLVNNEAFVCHFRKKDGSIREMVGQFGVAVGLKGGSNNKENYRNYATVWSITDQQYRTVNTDTLIDVSVHGNTFEVDNG